MPPSPLSELSEKWFGRSSFLRQTIVAVQTTPTRLAPNNPARFFLLAVNLSGNSGAVAWGNDLTTATGIPVAGNGGAFSLSVQEDGELTGYELIGVNAALAGNWLVVEVISL